jgi:Delta 1-pyrroline-5-carboxylate dehydrogenase
MEQDRAGLMALAVREAGKTIPDALSEVREAVDFLRYYAQRARADFARPLDLPGPTGERNQLALAGAGSSPASAPGISPSPFSPARCPRRSPPAMPSWPSPRSRRPSSPCARSS